MNSVTSRWSILPIRTVYLVGLPLVAAWIVLGMLVGAWTPVLHRIVEGIDMPYVLAVFLTGAVATQALAWLVPRRPGQFWVAAALLFLSMLLAAAIPQESRAWPELRSQTLVRLGLVSLGLGAAALWAARRNRCGDWPGEIPLAQVWDRLRSSRDAGRVFRSCWAATVWTEVVPVCRTFLASWLVLAFLIAGCGTVSLWLKRPDAPVNWGLIGLAMVMEALPNFGVIWLMGWGLFLGCEQGFGFQTKLTPFRATRPVTVGTLAGTRLAALVVVWLCVWIPLLVLQGCCIPDDAGMPPHLSNHLTRQANELLASRMLFSVGVLIAALPVLLWGRLEGFPIIFLATLVAWAWSWIASGFVHQESCPSWLTLALVGWMALKLVTACWLLARAWRRGYTTWRFPVVLVVGWILIVALMLWLFADTSIVNLSGPLGLAVLMPLVRLAACPAAMAANRHG